MPTYQFEAIDAATGKEIRDTVDAANELEAQATIRSMGYMVTKIKARNGKAASGAAAGGRKPGRSAELGAKASTHCEQATASAASARSADLPRTAIFVPGRGFLDSSRTTCPLSGTLEGVYF